MTETHDPAGPGPRDEIRDTEAYRLGRATALLEELLDPIATAAERLRAREAACRFVDEERERTRAGLAAWEEYKRKYRPDGPRADAPVEVVTEAGRYDHPTHPHTHASDYDADTCDLCFPEDAGPRDPKQVQL